MAEPDPNLVVEACGVSKWFGETTALDAVDLTVTAGDVHGLLGPNGAGKTTLLSAMFGLVVPDEGMLQLFGRTRAQAGPSGWTAWAASSRPPGSTPISAAGGIWRYWPRLDGGDAAALIDDALRRVGLTGAVARRKVRGYSLGMRQRLGLAAAMLRRPGC